MGLEFEKSIPPGSEPALAIVLLHGRGSDRHDLLGLRGGLPPEAMLITPQAPFPGAPWGYGPGWAWYRYLGDDRPDPESFDRAQDALGEFLAELPEHLPASIGTLVLGGFSQGGTMALAHALRNPGSVPHVLNLSGFLANHPGVPVTPESVRGSRIFWGHGTGDPAIPHALAERGRLTLREAGAELEARDYPIGHWVDPTELADVSRWVRAGLRPGAGKGGAS